MTMKITMDLSGFDKAKKLAKNAVRKEIMDATEDLLTKSVDLAPIKDSYLRGSGKSSYNFLGNKFEGQVNFGEIYAIWQHENTGFNHPGGGQAKYLEEPFMKMKPKYEKNIAAALNKVF